jgi:hypothetical protein
MGGFEDILGTAVVLLEFDDRAIGIIFLEIQDIAEICAAPGIDTLPVITNHSDVLMCTGQQFN